MYGKLVITRPYLSDIVQHPYSFLGAVTNTLYSTLHLFREAIEKL